MYLLVVSTLTYSQSFGQLCPSVINAALCSCLAFMYDRISLVAQASLELMILLSLIVKSGDGRYVPLHLLLLLQ